MASMVKKFRLAWISVSWPWMERKHYFSKYMNPYAHTHLHAPRPQSCNRICLCAALCPSGVVLNANQAHLTAQALVTQRFGNAATNVIQENSSVVQTKPGNGPSSVANKIKLIESQTMLQGFCAHPGLYLQPGGGKCGLCSPLQGRSGGGETPELILLQLWATKQCFHHAQWHRKAPTAMLPQPPWLSPFCICETGGSCRAQRLVLDFGRGSGAAVVSLGSVLCPACSLHTPAPFHGAQTRAHGWVCPISQKTTAETQPSLMTSSAPKALGAVSVTKASEHLLAFSTFFPSAAPG